MDLRVGYLFGVVTYTAWGFLPIYVRLLKGADAGEVIAHRVIWSVLFLGILVTVSRRWRGLRDVRWDAGRSAQVALGALLVAANWALFFYGVNSGRAAQVAIGYFLCPLVMAVFGMIIFREHVRPWQWSAIGLGAVAVLVLTVGYGQVPWIALGIASSFGVYPLLKKRLGLPPIEGMLLECGLLLLPITVYLWWLGPASKFGEGLTGSLLLVGLGVITCSGQVLYAATANRLPMVVMGMLQYLHPILQFIVAVAIFHEAMAPARWVGVLLIWIGLVIFAVDAIRAKRTPATENEMASPVDAYR